MLYGKNELDLENLAINVASEINKSGLNTRLLSKTDTAIFLKYSFSCNFDEREAMDIPDEDLKDWIIPNKVEFKSNRYKMDGTEAAVFAVADYPLRVRNAWGADLFNIRSSSICGKEGTYTKTPTR